MVGDVVTLDFTEISGNDPAKKMVIARSLDNPPWPETGKENLESSTTNPYFGITLTTFPKKNEKIQSDSDKHSPDFTSSVAPTTFLDYQPATQEDPSPAFVNFNVRKNINVILKHLPLITGNLGSPACAPYVVKTKEVFDGIWAYIDFLPREQAILLSTIEELFRGKKWREFQAQHIQLIEEKLNLAKNANITRKDLANSITKIQKSGLDIFPSSTYADDDDDSQEDDEI